MKFVGFIPARSGSKGIKEKNLVNLSGRPLINFTIDAALLSKKIDTIFISSDSSKILSCTNEDKVKKIKRPLEFSGDNASANDVIKHFISLDIYKDYAGIYMVYLQPTSPLRNFNHINQAITAFKKSRSSCLISVKPSSELPFKSFKLKNSKLTPLFNEESLTSNRQELPKTFYPNGAIYIFSIDAFISNNYQLPLNDCTPFIMSQSDSIDIDSHFDLKIAEEILNSKSI